MAELGEKAKGSTQPQVQSGPCVPRWLHLMATSSHSTLSTPGSFSHHLDSFSPQGLECSSTPSGSLIASCHPTHSQSPISIPWWRYAHHSCVFVGISLQSVTVCLEGLTHPCFSTSSMGPVIYHARFQERLSDLAAAARSNMRTIHTPHRDNPSCL